VLAHHECNLRSFTCTDSTDAVDARHLIGTNLAMYILIGIAGLYFAITIICFCIILCIW